MRIVGSKGDVGVFFGYDASRENVDIFTSYAWLSLLLTLLMLRLDVVDGFKAVSSVIMKLSCLWNWATCKEKVLIICQLYLLLLIVALDILYLHFYSIGHYV